jgi:hypothetical protein
VAPSADVVPDHHWQHGLSHYAADRHLGYFQICTSRKRYLRRTQVSSRSPTSLFHTAIPIQGNMVAFLDPGYLERFRLDILHRSRRTSSLPSPFPISTNNQVCSSATQS